LHQESRIDIGKRAPHPDLALGSRTSIGSSFIELQKSADLATGQTTTLEILFANMRYSVLMIKPQFSLNGTGGRA
jgi:hypothetical protein